MAFSKKAIIEDELIGLLNSIYEVSDNTELAKSLIALFASYKPLQKAIPHQNHWSEEDVILITYGDSILPNDLAQPPKKPLQTLHNFLQVYLTGGVSRSYFTILSLQFG